MEGEALTTGQAFLITGLGLVGYLCFLFGMFFRRPVEILHTQAFYEEVDPDQIDELARARSDLVSGRFADAKDRLERVLSELDSSWRIRA
jgi:hypothetical protein